MFNAGDTVKCLRTCEPWGFPEEGKLYKVLAYYPEVQSGLYVLPAYAEVEDLKTGRSFSCHAHRFGKVEEE